MIGVLAESMYGEGYPKEFKGGQLPCSLGMSYGTLLVAGVEISSIDLLFSFKSDQIVTFIVENERLRRIYCTEFTISKIYSQLKVICKYKMSLKCSMYIVYENFMSRWTAKHNILRFGNQISRLECQLNL